jgi:tetratricopeptide (TPR) repeat protein
LFKENRKIFNYILKDFKGGEGMLKRERLWIGIGLLLVFLLSGCTGGGGIGSESGQGSILLNIQEGWENIDKGDFDTAIEKFNQALSLLPEEKEKTEAITGLGWAYAKKGDIDSAISQFEKVKNLSNDANIGYVGVLLARGKSDDYQLAVDLLEHIDQYGGGLDNYSSSRTGVSNAEAHALLAYAYYLVGDSDKSKEHIERAQELDPNSESISDIKTALELLGLEIDSGSSN